MNPPQLGQPSGMTGDDFEPGDRVIFSAGLPNEQHGCVTSVGVEWVFVWYGGFASHGQATSREDLTLCARAAIEAVR